MLADAAAGRSNTTRWRDFPFMKNRALCPASESVPRTAASPITWQYHAPPSCSFRGGVKVSGRERSMAKKTYTPSCVQLASAARFTNTTC